MYKRQGYIEVEYEMDPADALFDRYVDKAPFVPGRKEEREKRCEEILAIQSMGLKKRMEHTHCRSVVIGISGGLDSTLALLVAARAVDRLNLPRTCITAVTMPCFGTTDRTCLLYTSFYLSFRKGPSNQRLITIWISSVDLSTGWVSMV